MAWQLFDSSQHARRRKGNAPKIGVLWHAGSAEEEAVFLSAFLRAFNELSYVQGQNIQFQHRFLAERQDLFRKYARGLVDDDVDDLVASTVLAAKEVERATNTIPLVFVIVADPVGAGLVDSLARPGRNATGLSLMAIDFER